MMISGAIVNGDAAMSSGVVFDVSWSRQHGPSIGFVVTVGAY